MTDLQTALYAACLAAAQSTDWRGMSWFGRNRKT